MLLKPDAFDFIANFDTLWQVVLGAALATLGGLAATLMERRVGRRERERNAALLFGEVLATLGIIVELAEGARGRGDPYGPVTMRLLRSAQREIAIYDRNRERLSDLEDGALRARIHTLMVRLSMALEGIFDAGGELARFRMAAAADPADGEPARRRDELASERETAFAFVIETSGQIGPLVTRLEPLARHSFQDLGSIARAF